MMPVLMLTAYDWYAIDGSVPGAVTRGCVASYMLRTRARSKVIVKHENHPLVVEATLVSNLQKSVRRVLLKRHSRRQSSNSEPFLRNTD